MATLRKPFQGVWNILRFNWHFYVLALIIIISLLILQAFTAAPFSTLMKLISFIIFSTTFISLFTSYFVYDRSDLYSMPWLTKSEASDCSVLNINAGFDETSALLQQKYPNAALTVLDFYDPKKHTEVSIQRARKAYPPYPGTLQMNTADLSFKKASFDWIIVLMAAHEIRNHSERIDFFAQLQTALKKDGKIYVTEHLRDLPNFLAYNIGFFHFHPKKVWQDTFEKSGLNVIQEIKTSPFITTFILKKNGATP